MPPSRPGPGSRSVQVPRRGLQIRPLAEGRKRRFRGDHRGESRKLLCGPGLVQSGVWRNQERQPPAGGARFDGGLRHRSFDPGDLGVGAAAPRSWICPPPPAACLRPRRRAGSHRLPRASSPRPSPRARPSRRLRVPRRPDARSRRATLPRHRRSCARPPWSGMPCGPAIPPAARLPRPSPSIRRPNCRAIRAPARTRGWCSCGIGGPTRPPRPLRRGRSAARGSRTRRPRPPRPWSRAGPMSVPASRCTVPEPLRRAGSPMWVLRARTPP